MTNEIRAALEVLDTDRYASEAELIGMLLMELEKAYGTHTMLCRLLERTSFDYGKPILESATELLEMYRIQTVTALTAAIRAAKEGK